MSGRLDVEEKAGLPQRGRGVKQFFGLGKPRKLTIPQLPRPEEPTGSTTPYAGPIKDLHATLVATRNLEIGLFWQRANYFLVLNSALAIGFFNLKDKDAKYTLVFGLVGLVASALWFWVCLGGKFWQTRWEQRLMDFEASYLPGISFFSADLNRIKDDVARGLSFHPTHGLKRLIYETVLEKKPSVSFSMILLAALFMLGWATLSALYILS